MLNEDLYLSGRDQSFYSISLGSSKDIILTTGLVSEDPVHSRNRLHQAVTPHRLVHVQRVHAGAVEAG